MSWAEAIVESVMADTVEGPEEGSDVEELFSD